MANMKITSTHWDAANNCVVTKEITRAEFESAERQDNAAADLAKLEGTSAIGVSKPASYGDLNIPFLAKAAVVADAIHPAPAAFSAEQLTLDPILRFFHYAHLPLTLQGASKPFCDLAHALVETLPRNAERTVALRKLLEAKDAAVRANVA